ncbi:Gfo/Idh/MocA family oxidoreductase [Pullulanibacillus sp. KACC 23026]|uniref:Gfo/Idh/MocA family protein n=1 Tax=Pullulanibacillus sp. KACC 23026 TaxID=3028315 RepID=UPI0023AEFADB|nr:Gfo/Idh/MocA family oxidoreductase [Pullulanibacillus sp. KACC 23026]WEG13156.1 Gfo/Idh/MocA family oxidoreductase [Pullulanibacillus sp. KACC 23026]
MKQLNIGVIGAGSISDMHLSSYSNNPSVQLMAIADINQERAEQKAEKYGVKTIYTDYQELLENPDIEAVSICTWNNLHAEMAISALEAGKHVLVEKPLAKTVEQAMAIQEAVQKSGKTLQVGFVRRHASNTKLVKEFIDSGEFGDIYYGKASILRRLGNPGGWFSDIERSGGGPVIDLGVHIIDLLWYLMGKPKVKSVSGNTYNKLGNRKNIQNLSFYKAADYDPSKNTVEDLANALIRFENGASIMVDVSFTLHAKKDESSVKLYGEKGGAEIEPELVIVTEKFNTIINAIPQVDSLGFNFIEAFQNEINHFVEAVLSSTKTNSPVEDGVEIMKILSAIYESAAKGEEIQF